MAAQMINAAFDAMDSGKMDQAVALFQRAVKSFPDSIEARVNYAACLAECNKGTEALAELETVLSNHPDSFEARGNAAMIAMELNNNAAAEKHFEAAVVLPSGRNWFDGHYNLANLLAERGAGWESQVNHNEIYALNAPITTATYSTMLAYRLSPTMRPP